MGFTPRSVLFLAFFALLGASPFAAGAGDVQRGEPMFLKHCAGCHGPKGRGAAKTFMPHVHTLTKKDYIELLPDEYLVQIISGGGPVVGKSSFMPAWKSALSDDDIADIVAYIRSLPLY